MSLLLCIIISIAVNLDNFLIGINLGLKGRHLRLSSNLLIAAMTALSTFIAAFVTWMISDKLLTFSNAIGAIFLIFFGFYCLIHNEDDNEITEKYKDLSFKKSLILGIVLAINCIPPAFSAGMLSIHPIIISLFAGLFSFFSMFISNHFGSWFTTFGWIKKLTPLSNLLLIISGVIEIFLLL